MSHDRQEPSSEDYFVLDDEEKVEIVNDRGQSLYPKHFESQGSPGGVAISDNDPCKHISNKLSEAPVSCFLDNNNKFVHRGEFDKIVTREVVKLIDPSLLGYGDMTSSKDREWLVREIFGNLPVDGQIQPCIRLLCVLLKIERLDKFKDLWSKEMTDSCLPLTRDGHYNLSCRVHGVSHTAINDLPLQKRKDFVLWARRLTPPFVVWKPSIHRHYILEKGDPLPMVRVKGGEIDDRGEFGEVTKVKIKHDDGKFASHPLRSPDRHFAVKKLEPLPENNARKHFDSEVRACLHAYHSAECGEMSKYGDFRQNLTPLLATFEIVNPVGNPRTYCLLFDCAKANLKQLWKTKDVKGKSDYLPRIAKHLTELSGALACIHNCHNDQGQDQSSRDFSNLCGRHGDIKPSNILYFEVPKEKGKEKEKGGEKKEEKEEYLAICDFGQSRLHRNLSKSGHDPSDINIGDMSYRAPEFDAEGGMISPACDVFSMGCVFLEHITWFLSGQGGIVEFEHQRELRGSQGPIKSSAYFSLKPGTKSAVVNEVVKDWIGALKEEEECCEYLREVLEFIRVEMLKLNSVDRISAKKVYDWLKQLQEGYFCPSTPP